MGRMVLRFLLSLRTTLWSLVALMLLFLAGAFVMPAREEFKTIHAKPMLEWLTEQPLEITWWLWGSIVILVLLSVNTLFCSVESLLRKRSGSSWLLAISPQVIHAGFILMLVAHLISSLGSFQHYEVAAEGSVLRLSESTAVVIRGVQLSSDSGGYVTDWSVSADFFENRSMVKRGDILPNSPLFYGDTGVYVRDLRAYPRKMVLVEISREPGVLWALAGGVLFMIGSISLIVLKMKREGQQDKSLQ